MDDSSSKIGVRLGPRLTLSSPVVAAAGGFGWGDELLDFTDRSELGALITPSVTREARLDSPPPRTSEASAGLIHALGLPNPGVEAFISDFLPKALLSPCPVIVSVAAETMDDWEFMAKRLEAAGGVAALELNLTPFCLLCAERASDRFPDETKLLDDLYAAVASTRESVELPIIAKLPSVGAEIGDAARTALDAGADVIAVSQAFPAVAVRLSGRNFRFPGIVGGLSGPAIKPLALYQTWRAATSVNIPVLGSGGIMTGEDALEFIVTGATAVSVGVASLIHPTAIGRITGEIRDYMQKNKVGHIGELVGAALS